MTKEEIFAIWAPEDSAWSRWAKPVLFAYVDSALSNNPMTETAGDVTWAPPASDNVALVLDLPCQQGALTGVALAASGYRPVPLYNALPSPYGKPPLNPLAGCDMIAVNVLPILSALRFGAEELSKLKIPAGAPPVFLLDCNRAGTGRRLQPHEFDNRSISFTTDFPSANFMAFHGIQRAILVQGNREVPHSDVAHTLRRWQDAGIVLERKRLDFPGPPEIFEVAKPSWYGAMFQRALASVGLRRAWTGGFGAWMPDSSAGG